MLLRVAREVGDARHGAVVVHDLADHAGRTQPGEHGQVDRRLGLAGALEHAAAPRAQREDVARPQQVVGTGARIDRGQDGGGAVGRRDPGRDLAARLDRHRERGAERRGVVLHHEREPQLVAALLGQGEADEAAAVARHEVDGVGRDLLRRDREVALVLAVLVVDDDHEPALAERLDRILDAGEGGLRRHAGRGGAR